MIKCLPILFILSSWISTATYAQNDPVIDSLLNVLHIENKDTIIINTYLDLSFEYLVRGNLGNSLEYGEKALQRAESIGFNKGIVRAYQSLGLYHYVQGQFSEALRKFELSYEMAKQFSLPKSVISSLIWIGNIQEAIGKNNLGLESFTQALEMANVNRDTANIAAAHSAIGLSLFRRGNFNEALTHDLKALEIRKKEGDTNEKAIAFANLAMTQIYLGAYSESIDHYLEAIRIWEQLHNKRNIFNAYSNIVISYSSLGNYDEAARYASLALTVSTALGDKSMIAFSSNNLGKIHHERGQYTEALDYYYEALRLFEELHDELSLATALGNIGLIHALYGDYQKALEFATKQFEIIKRIGNKAELASSLNNMGQCYFNLGELEKCEAYFHAALKIVEELGDKHQTAMLYDDLGHLHECYTNVDVAMNYNFMALRLHEEIQNPSGIARSNFAIGKVYAIMGDIPAAKGCLNESLSVYESLGFNREISELHQHLSSLDHQSGLWEQAFINLGVYISLRDSLFTSEINRKLIQLQAQYIFDRKEDSLIFEQSLVNEQLQNQRLLSAQQSQSLLLRDRELDLLRKNRDIQDLTLEKSKVELEAEVVNALRKQDQLSLLTKESQLESLETTRQRKMKNVLIGSIGVLFGLVLLGYNIYIGRQKLKLLKLRNKIASDLHDDVGSTLSSISIFSEMARQQSKEVIPMLDSIGESSRKMLEAMGDIVWTIHPENDDFEKILDRMRSFAYELLGAQKIDFVFEADHVLHDRKLPMNVRRNLYLIFKEATNNMARYAEADMAHFSLKEENQNLTMMIQDNGKGFDPDQLSSGNGLRNMKKRAEEIGGKLWIQSKRDEGTLIKLSVAV